ELSSGFPEGWALYAEKLMAELGMYGYKEFEFGMLMNHLFRACRVVIDLGIHLEKSIPKDFFFHPGEKWSFELGRQMLIEVVGLGHEYARDEMIRYCGNPGQAISYKIGEKVILNLRKLMERYDRTYNLKDFHDLILS